MPENRVFFPALDGMRGIAFIMVLLQHYFGLPWGWTGVDLFFVLSGFLISGILFDTRNSAHYFRNFYVRRTLRIFPLYYGIMLALLLTFPLFRWRWTWHWLVWAVYLGNFARFVHPYVAASPLERLADFQPVGFLGHHQVTPFLGHFWSLCVEEQFYLVWPLIVFWIRDRRKLMWVCASTLPVCLVLRLLGQHFLPAWMLDNEILYRATPFRVDALLLGGLVALWLRGGKGDRLIRLGNRLFPFALAFMVGSAMVIANGHLFRVPYLYPSWKFTWGLTVIDLFSALLILACLREGSITNRTLRLPPLRWLGRISYGAYVLHDIPHLFYLQLGHKILPRHTTSCTTAVAFFGTLGLAWLSFRFFESPFLDLKERWTIRD